jgi:hypothetical protein
MKNFFGSTVFSAAFIGALVIPAIAQAQVNYGPTQSTYTQQGQQNATDPNNAVYETYVPPMNFNFGQEQQEEGPGIVNQYSSKYKKDFKDPNTKELPALLPTFEYTINFIRVPGSSGQVVMRMMMPLALSGCVKMKHPVITIRETPPLISLRATSLELEIDKSVRYAHFQCDVRSQYAYFDLPLDRDNLLEKNIRKINVRSDAGHFRNIDLDVNENRLIAMISGNQTKAGMIPGAGGMTTFWFFPENTIVLSAGEKLDTAARTELKSRARGAGLVPVEEQIVDFKPDPVKTNIAYFIDPTGRWKDQISDAGKPVAFGTIAASETFFGPNGQYQQPRNIQVFARVPGANE